MSSKQMTLLPSQARPRKKKLVTNSRNSTAIGNGSILDLILGSGGVENLTQTLNPFNSQGVYLTLNPRLLTALYREDGLTQKIVSTPANDSIKKGVDIYSDALEEQEIKDLQKKIKKIGIFDKVKEAQKQADLYGVAYILIDDSTNDIDGELSASNLDLDNVNFIVGNRWELTSYQTGMEDKELLKSIDKMLYAPDNEHILYKSIKVHKSRYVWFYGTQSPLPSYTAGLRHLSVIEKIDKAMTYYLNIKAAIYYLLKEAKLDVYKYDGFSNALLSEEQMNRLNAQLAMSSQIKNMMSAIVLDKDNDYEQKQITFSGIHELYIQARKDVSSVSGIPMTKLFGESAAGFSSGEDDRQNYQSMVEEKQSQMANSVYKILDLIITAFIGFEVDFDFEFKSFTEEDKQNKATIEQTEVGTTLAAYQAGVISNEEARERLVSIGFIKGKLI